MLALYRAADLADQQGIAVIRIVDQGITVTKMRGDYRTLNEGRELHRAAGPHRG